MTATANDTDGAAMDVTNKYDPEKKKVYVNYAIFGLEIQDGYTPNNGSNNASKPTKAVPKQNEPSNEPVDVNDNELPF